MSYLFDDVARTLANPTASRRQSLKLLGGLLAGGILGAAGIARAAQDKRKIPCTGLNDTDCPPGKVCRSCKRVPTGFCCKKPSA